MARIALINPDYYEDIFKRSKVRAALSRGTPPLGLLTIAAPLLQAGHNVKVINLNLKNRLSHDIDDFIREFKPDFVGITSTTPLIKKVYKIASRIKAIEKNIMVIAGGPHCSALPHDVLRESEIDCVVIGEGDFVMKMIVDGCISETIPNIVFKNNGLISESKMSHQSINDLDSLPYPAYELVNVKDYHQPMISSRKRPLGYMETSRGCFARCIYCNKNIHGFKVRFKSPARVVDEMERMLTLGFKEIHIIDDIFTANKKRAFAICEEILKRNLKFPWYPRGGLRPDTVNLELLRIMKRAGCYRIPFGIESGSQRIIDRIHKRMKLEQAEEAVRLSKMAGMEIECYFMIGLPTETEEDIKSSIDFAIKLDPDYVKFAITIPLPGTPLFEQMSKMGHIKTRDWEKYNFSQSPKEIYDHDSLSWQIIDLYSVISYRRFYFRPKYILRMLLKTIKGGTFWGHAKAFFNTRW